MPQIINLSVKLPQCVGKKAGYLTAIKPSKHLKNGCRLWEFKCDCGETCYFNRSAVFDGNITSCGCKRGTRITRKNWEGRRVGVLTVLAPSDDKPRTKCGSVLWDCICECGRKRIVSSSSLNNRRHEHCICERLIKKTGNED